MTADRQVVCPFCRNQAVLANSAEVYGGRSYGMIWLCRPCGAWVGCHKNSPTHEPLGTLANAGLRKLRTQVHALLDPIWKAGIRVDGPACAARSRTYAWLARQLGIEKDQCHVGMFDSVLAARALEVVRTASWSDVSTAVPFVPRGKTTA